MMIEASNTRRFQGPEGEVLAIADQCRAYSTYGAVAVDAQGRAVLINIRAYFPDEVEEI